jgi:plastocyanin
MRRALLVCTTLVVLVVSGSPTLGATKAFRAAGSQGDFRWSPGTQTIAKGDRIRWRNPLSGSHTVVSYSTNWSFDKTVPSGEAVGKRFRRRGTFRFRCTLTGHSSLDNGVCSGMCGKVVVR